MNLIAQRSVLRWSEYCPSDADGEVSVNSGVSIRLSFGRDGRWVRQILRKVLVTISGIAHEFLLCVAQTLYRFRGHRLEFVSLLTPGGCP